MAKRDRMSNEVNAGSMADIAFLLLIFFLVTTTIAVDKGITIKLPPWSDEKPDPLALSKRNVFSVLVNSQNQLLVRGEPAQVSDLKARAKEFIMNPNNRDDLASKPTKAVISLKNDRGTQFKTYIEVYNELKAAYNELWNEESLKTYHMAYSDKMPKQYKKEIKKKIPLVISEAELSSFGEEK